MKKKSIIVLLSAILVLVLASTGVCFADSSNLISFPYTTNGASFSNGVLNTTSNGGRIGFNVSALTNGQIYYLVGNIVMTNPPSPARTFTIMKGNQGASNTNADYLGTSSDSTITVPDTAGSIPIAIQFTYDSQYNWINFVGNQYYGSLNLTDLVITDDNPFGTVDRFSFSLPYGNALLISSNSDFTINRRSYNISNTTYNYQKYVRASDNFSYRVNGSYQGVVENCNLVGTFGVNVFGSNDVMSLLIPWQPVNQNVLGRATEYNFYNASLNPADEISVLSGQSFMIWYPYYANNQDTSKINETNMEVAIDIFHSSPITFTTFPITGSTASSGEDAYIQNTASTSSGGSSSQSNSGDGSINVTFDNAPTAGGNHGQAPINDNNSILGVLSNLQNTLLGLFNKAIDGIHNLITLGSDFLQSVQIMFSWLPAELLVIITSGFIILLTIGVLKTLWR